jgi:hypothetical protein
LDFLFTRAYQMRQRGAILMPTVVFETGTLFFWMPRVVLRDGTNAFWDAQGRFVRRDECFSGCPGSFCETGRVFFWMPRVVLQDGTNAFWDAQGRFVRRDECFSRVVL